MNAMSSSEYSGGFQNVRLESLSREKKTRSNMGERNKTSLTSLALTHTYTLLYTHWPTICSDLFKC